ncbi:ABC transporter permease subunit [Terribacillus sp. DMT04]|uniref:ABC transporter permease subunit n=1 Tax=Terribacillus sp. DMT04 TaxID=2850441 RepID=UPI001C2C6200|nr:ABC transporter permease subunit [Terribacillus sp. DMT04]QXE01556.1 ABC transporter permease subunit [Terribacillus sp. DMT04]
MKVLVNELTKLIIFLLIILFISMIPLFINSSGTQLPNVDATIQFVRSLLTPQSLTYSNNISDIERPLFPLIFIAFRSSFTIFFLSFLLSLGLAFLLSYTQLFIPHRVNRLLQIFVSTLHSIPDIVYIISAQLLVVAAYQLTRIQIFHFTGAGDAEAVALPVLVLSIVPTLFLFQTLSRLIEIEWKKPYIEVAKGKGLSHSEVLRKHLLRNVFVQLSYNLKFIIATLLGNLFIVEVLFNNFGLTTFLLSYTQPAIFFISAFLLFIPIYILLKLMEIALYFMLGKGVEL